MGRYVCGFETYERVDKTDEIIAAGYDLLGRRKPLHVNYYLIYKVVGNIS